ncbi:ATP-binding protein (plasmid) [Pseudoalteromonas sp. T1lg65]|uniref:ATP-binding protein n=1 Tax=Pseudoalteromonas sp. T1lg65 TaxID=2077101 RepID=UPI003F7AD628
MASEVYEQYEHAYTTERRAAHLFYLLGQALKSQDDELEQVFNEFHCALDALTATARFTSVELLFLLSPQELRVLALVYLQQQDPDIIAPFLGLSWFEQGPMLSLDKLLTLVDPKLSKQNALQYINQDAAVFKWGLLRLQNDGPAMQRSVYLSPFLEQYLQFGRYSHEQLNYFSCSYPELDPVFDVLTASVSSLTTHSLVSLHVSDGAASWYIEQSALRNNASVAVFIGDENTGIDWHYLLSDLACLRVRANGKPVYLYWPDVGNLSSFLQTKLKSILTANTQIQVFTETSTEQLERSFPAVYEMRFASPTLLQRAQAWLALCSHTSASEQDKSQANRLAAKYPVALSRMKLIAERAQTEQQSEYWQTLQVLCFQAQSQHCDELAKLCQARYTLKDMMLQDKVAAQLRELVARVNLQTELQSRLPRFTQGCKALFWGKPGTGKSMAAEAIAGELQLPLYIVNLANIASKWIGETEKHLAKLFDSAERNNAVLMFDEADAIFAKRSEVESSHDKNANMGVSYLLQRMEHYSGLLLLSTNFKNNLDEAFLRRFHGVIEFTLPTEHERVLVWTRHLEGNADNHLQQGIGKLAALFELSAAQIINICEVALLQSLMANKPLISRNEVANAIHREMAKQHGGYMAQHSLTNWLQG